MKAVVVGSMNCLLTEYAVALTDHFGEVVHYYDANEMDALSNPNIRWGNNSGIITDGVIIKKIRFHHHLSYLLPRIFHRKMLMELKAADLVLLSGPSISIARLITGSTKKNIIAISYGNDISFYCNLEWPALAVSQIKGVRKLAGPIFRKLKSTFVNLQILGLKACTHYSYFLEGFDASTDALLKKIMAGESKPIRLPRYSVNVDILKRIASGDPLARYSKYYKILFPVRFSEGNELLGNKGWRMLFDALKKYRAVTGVSFICICFRKGNYSAAQSYASELGIDDLIEWRDVVPFDKLVQYYGCADVVVEQLGSHWIGQGLYAMALGKPVLGSVPSKMQFDFFRESGLLVVESSDSLVKHLVDCESARYRKEIGAISSEFVNSHASMRTEIINWNIF